MALGVALGGPRRATPSTYPAAPERVLANFPRRTHHLGYRSPMAFHPRPRPDRSTLLRSAPTRRPLGLLLGAAMLLACACASGPKRVSPTTELEIYRDSANVFYRTEDLARAEAQASKGLEIERRDVPLRLMLGWISLRRGDTANLMRAEQIFREVLEDAKDNTQARLGLGEALERLGVVSSQSADTIEAGDRLPRRGTPLERAEELRADALKKWREAMTHYESTLVQRGGSFKALNGLQRTASLLGNYAQSLEYGERLIALSEAEAEDFRRLIEQGSLQPGQELELRKSELRSRRLRVEAHLLASDLLMQLERPGDSIAHLDAAIEVDPRRVDALGRRAELRTQAGDFHGAIEDIDRLLAASTELPYEHPDIRRAYDLRATAEKGRQGNAAMAPTKANAEP